MLDDKRDQKLWLVCMVIGGMLGYAAHVEAYSFVVAVLGGLGLWLGYGIKASLKAIHLHMQYQTRLTGGGALAEPD